MKAKIKSGWKLLSPYNHWDDIKDKMIVNFEDRWTFIEFKQSKNHLLIYTTKGWVDIVFTGEVPKLEFDHQEKDQVVFKVFKNEISRNQ